MLKYITRYDSLAGFMKDVPKTRCKESFHSQSDWYGGLGYGEALKGVWSGDSQALKDAEKLLEKMQTEGTELSQDTWETDKAGSFPLVPAFIAGDPEHMYRFSACKTEYSPLKIVVDMFISASFSARDLRARGKTILALVRKLQSVRPVELYLAMGTQNSARNNFITPLIQLESNTMDLTSLSFVLGNPSFTRHLLFSWCWNNGAGSEIPYCHETEDYLRNAAIVGENDLYISGAILSRDVLDNPVDWVNAQVRKFAEVIE